MKRILAALLAVVMLAAVCFTVPAAAADAETAQQSAELLYNLGLFRGTGTNRDGSPMFDLNRAPTRAEAIVMLVRLLGKENEASGKGWATPFKDVPAWAQPYVGYAYANGLTNGSDPAAGLFGSNDNVTAGQYFTFLLRALGYRDGTDFTWTAPWNLAASLGITGWNSGNKSAFLRGDVAVVSAQALYAARRTDGKSLLEYLLSNNALKESAVVIWDYRATAFENNFAAFLFYPVAGSPATFKSFRIDEVTVNSCPCQTTQLTSPSAVTAYMSSAGEKASGFCYIEINYNQSTAEKAATSYYTASNKKVYPLLGFTFHYSGVRTDGTAVSGTFTDYYYNGN